MAQALSLLPLLATIAMRQALESALRQRAPTARPGTGRASIVFWYLAYSLLLALAGVHLWSVPLMSQPWYGYAVVWSGIALRLVALRELGAYYHTLVVIRDRHRLIDTGPYRFVRHPLHLGLHLEMAGLALLADSAVGWIALALSILVLVRRNREEERALEDYFGTAYAAYRRRSWDLVDL